MASLLDLELDLPLADTPASRFLAWIAGGLVFLAVLAFAGRGRRRHRRGGWRSSPASSPWRCRRPGPPGCEPMPRSRACWRRWSALEGVAFAPAVAVEGLRRARRTLAERGGRPPPCPLPRLVDVAFNPAGSPAARWRRSPSLVPGRRSTGAAGGRSERSGGAAGLALLALGPALPCSLGAWRRGGRRHPDEPRSAPGDRRPAPADGGARRPSWRASSSTTRSATPARRPLRLHGRDHGGAGASWSPGGLAARRPAAADAGPRTGSCWAACRWRPRC